MGGLYLAWFGCAALTLSSVLIISSQFMYLDCGEGVWSPNRLIMDPESTPAERRIPISSTLLYSYGTGSRFFSLWLPQLMAPHLPNSVHWNHLALFCCWSIHARTHVFTKKHPLCCHWTTWWIWVIQQSCKPSFFLLEQSRFSSVVCRTTVIETSQGLTLLRQVTGCTFQESQSFLFCRL